MTTANDDGSGVYEEGMGKMRTCGLADRCTDKLRTELLLGPHFTSVGSTSKHNRKSNILATIDHNRNRDIARQRAISIARFSGGVQSP